MQIKLFEGINKKKYIFKYNFKIKATNKRNQIYLAFFFLNNNIIILYFLCKLIIYFFRDWGIYGRTAQTFWMKMHIPDLGSGYTPIMLYTLQDRPQLE